MAIQYPFCSIKSYGCRRRIFVSVSVLLLLAMVVGCSGGKETPLDKLLHQKNLDVVEKKEEKPTDKNGLSIETRIRNEMADKINNDLDAIGTPAQRRQLLERIKAEGIEIPRYLYQQAVVNQYLFDIIFMRSVGLYTPHMDTFYKYWQDHKGDIDVKPDPKAPKKEEDPVIKVGSNKVGKPVDAVFQPPEFATQNETSKNYLAQPAGFLAKIFYVTAPDTVDPHALLKFAESLRTQFLQEPSLDESTLDTFLASLNAKKKELSEKTSKHPKKEGEEDRFITESDFSIARDGLFAKAGSLVVKKGWTKPPLVDEPAVALFGTDGELIAKEQRNQSVSKAFASFQNIPKGKIRVGFYVKLLDISAFEPTEQEVLDTTYNIMFYFTSDYRFTFVMAALIKSGDFSVYPENLFDKK